MINIFHTAYFTHVPRFRAESRAEIECRGAIAGAYQTPLPSKRLSYDAWLRSWLTNPEHALWPPCPLRANITKLLWNLHKYWNIQYNWYQTQAQWYQSKTAKTWRTAFKEEILQLTLQFSRSLLHPHSVRLSGKESVEHCLWLLGQ